MPNARQRIGEFDGKVASMKYGRPIKFVFCAMVTVLVPGALAKAGPQECADAANSYNSALEDVSYALRAYSRCVSDSRGHDDCSSEFSRLRSAQDDFETAVSEYESECS